MSKSKSIDDAIAIPRLFGAALAAFLVLPACGQVDLGTAASELAADAGSAYPGGGGGGGGTSGGDGSGSMCLNGVCGMGGGGACEPGSDLMFCAAGDDDPRAAPDDVALRIAQMNARAARLGQLLDIPGWQATSTYMMGGPGKVVFGLSKPRQLREVIGYLPIWKTAGPPPTYAEDAATVNDVVTNMPTRDLVSVYSGGVMRQYRFMSDDDMKRLVSRSDVGAMGFTDWDNQPAKETASDNLLAEYDLEGCVAFRMDDDMLKGWLTTNYSGSILVSTYIHGFPSPNIWDPINTNTRSGYSEGRVVVCRRQFAATAFVLREVTENYERAGQPVYNNSDEWKDAARSWVAIYAQDVPLLDGRDRPFAERAFKAAENVLRAWQNELGNYAANAGLAAIAVTPIGGTALAIAEGNWGLAFGRLLLDMAMFTGMGAGRAAQVLSFVYAGTGVLVMYFSDQRACAAAEARDARVVAARGGWVEANKALAHGGNRIPCKAGVAAADCAAAKAGIPEINDGVAAICGQAGLDDGTRAACNTRVGHFPIRDWGADVRGVRVDDCANL